MVETRNSRWGPGGLDAAVAGAVTRSRPAPAVKGRKTSPWFSSKAWVIEPGRTRLILAMEAASGVVTSKVVP